MIDVGVPQRKRRRGGPRSAAGKAIASRNALRHGFAANIHRQSVSAEKVEALAKAISADDADPAVRAQALKIAEVEFLLSEISAHKVLVIERLREAYAAPFSSKDNSLQLGTARFMQAWLAHREIEKRLPAIVEKYSAKLFEEALATQKVNHRVRLENDESLRKFFSDDAAFAKFIQESVDRMSLLFGLPFWMRKLEADDPVPVWLKSLLEEPDSPATGGPTTGSGSDESGERDEYEALQAAVLDLERLDRYEHRAWARQKRAILQLANLKLSRRFA